MFKYDLPLRAAGPTILLSLLLLGLCIAAATYLYSQQATSADVLKEDVSSNWVAHDLENTVDNVVRLLRDRDEHVDALHERIREQLAEARKLADKEEENRLVGQLEHGFSRYLAHWQMRQPGSQSAEEDAIRILQADFYPVCNRLQDFNTRQVKASETAHRQAVQWMAWGLAVVGGVGALAGLLLGYGVARGLRRSIYQLSVRVKDAADKLRQELPTVVLTENGDLHHLHEQMQGLVRDIEQVVDKLQQREREVLRADQLVAVGQLAAGVAHELRNPLCSIKMLVQANREEAQARGVAVEDLHIIELEIRRMERSLQTFLDYARPPKPERRTAALGAIVDRTFALIGGRARKQQVTLQFTKPDKPVVIEADAEQMQQLLVNLMLNALDVMPRGGVLDVELRAAAEGFVELRVADTGPGIAPELLPRLFEPFVSSKETGLGLGLVISRRIAENHGGSLQAGSSPTGGACFVLRLPAPATTPVAVA